MNICDEDIMKCAVLECRKTINIGDTYYLLGGGKVVTCEECACHGKLGKFGERRWDKVDKWVLDKIRKVR